MALESSLPCSEGPAVGTSPERNEFSPHLHTVSLRSVLILTSHLHIKQQI